MDDEFVKSLDYITEQINRCLPLVIFIFGSVGNILNCLVLSQRILRSNPCALLFLVSSFIDLISILFGLPTRILAGWHHDPTTTVHSVCKLRAFIVFSTRTMAIWLVTLATIDRWLLSCVNIHRRHMSTLKNVRRGIIVTIIFSTLSYTHMLYCYEANITDAPLKCYGKSEACRLTTDLIYALITIMIPSILMITFGLMIISNVRHLRMRIQTVAIISMATLSRKESKIKKTDHQLLRMLLAQVFLLIILCVPQAIQKFYITFKPFGSVSDREDALNNFLYNIELLLAFIASGMPFYVYTLSGGIVFRRASIDLIKAVQQKLAY